MENKFTKLKDLVGDSFTVTAVPGYKYKLWDSAEKRMITRDTYEEGFRKLYQVETDKGTLDMGSGQLGNLLEATFYKGTADLIGKTFGVKSNGKEGMDIRYYFNVMNQPVPTKTIDPNEPPIEAYEPPAGLPL